MFEGGQDAAAFEAFAGQKRNKGGKAKKDGDVKALATGLKSLLPGQTTALYTSWICPWPPQPRG